MDNTPWELAEDDGWSPYRPGNLDKIITCLVCLIPLAGVGTLLTMA